MQWLGTIIAWVIFLTTLYLVALIFGEKGAIIWVAIWLYLLVNSSNRSKEKHLDSLKPKQPSKREYPEAEVLAEMIDTQRAKDKLTYYKTPMTSVPVELYDEYNSYLRSAVWRTLRKTVIKRDNHRCTECGYIGDLEVHHEHYRGIFEMEFTSDQLTTLCNMCHRARHIKLKEAADGTGTTENTFTKEISSTQ